MVLRSAGSIDRRDLAALVGAAICWGLGTVVSKAALAEIAPVTLLAIQLASSLGVLTLLMRWRGIPLRGDGPALLGRLGLLNPGAAYALGLLGLVSITASVSVLLWALEPIMIMFLAAVALRERITPTLVALSVAALIGIALVVYDSASIGAQAVGVLLALAGVACCAAYTVITRRYIPDARETGQVVLAQQTYAFALALVLVWSRSSQVARRSPRRSRPSPSGVRSPRASSITQRPTGSIWARCDACRRRSPPARSI